MDHDDFDLAVPTPDHVIPLLYIAAFAAVSDDTVDVLVDGPAYGSISMTTYTLGADCPPPASETAATHLHQPASVPPDQTNI